MTDLPSLTILDSDQNAGPFETLFIEPQLNFLKEQPGGSIEDTQTIATGVIVPAVGESRAIQIDTEAAAATDFLDNITNTNVPVGGYVQLRSTDTGRVIEIRHQQGGAGQITLRDGVSYFLDDPQKRILFQRVGTDFEEVWRSGDRDLRAEIATTSGTVHTFSTISANTTFARWTSRAVSHSAGTSPTLRLRVGDGTIKISGYNEQGFARDNIQLSAGMVLGDVLDAQVEFQLMDRANNRWSYKYYAEETGGTRQGVGEFTLTNPLSDIQLDWSGGETFDAGSISLSGR